MKAETTYVPGGRLYVPRSASRLSREGARCSASGVHASNGKPSASVSGGLLLLQYSFRTDKKKTLTQKFS